MNKDIRNLEKPPPQTEANPEGKTVTNPFENNQSADRDIEQAKEELEKEQEFKEAQTERD